MSLTAIGDRPETIVMPRGFGPVRTKAEAVALATQFIRETQSLWDVSFPLATMDVAVEKYIWRYRHAPDGPKRPKRHKSKRRGAAAWALEMPCGQWCRLAILIDADTGRLAARLARVPTPDVTPCALPKTAPDARYVDSLLALDPDEARRLAVLPLDRDQFQTPYYGFFEGITKQNVRFRRLAVYVPGKESRTYVLDLSAHVVGTEQEILDDWLEPSSDASPLEERLYVTLPDNDSDT